MYDDLVWLSGKHISVLYMAMWELHILLNDGVVFTSVIKDHSVLPCVAYNGTVLPIKWSCIISLPDTEHFSTQTYKLKHYKTCRLYMNANLNDNEYDVMKSTVCLNLWGIAINHGYSKHESYISQAFSVSVSREWHLCDRTHMVFKHVALYFISSVQ
jgi:hypothetical protein